MSTTIPSFEEALENSKEAFFDVARYCLSDKVARPLNCVTKGQATPVGYARYIHQKHSDHFFTTFGLATLPVGRKIPQELKDAWVYDRILEAVLFYRVSEVRPINIGDVSALVATSLPYALTINDKHIAASSFAGLTSFKINTSVFVDAYGLSCDLASVGITKRLISAVGDMENSNWLLYNPIWQKALLGNEDRLRVLRGFLHAVTIAVVSTDDSVIGNFEITRQALLENVEEFIEIVESSETQVKDIVRFLESIEYYTYEMRQHNLLSPLFEMPFPIFEAGHYRIFGNRYQPLEEIRMESNVEDRPEWKILRDLGEEFAPEAVITTDIPPYAFVREIVNHHLPTIWSQLAETFNQFNKTHLPKDFPKSRFWFEGVIADQLYCSLMQRRMLYLEPESKKVIQEVVKNMAHVLLILEDGENERYGLSLVEELLELHVKDNIDKFSERELETMTLLMWAWQQLSLTRPNRMEKSWKTLLKDAKHRRQLRHLMFTIIETINIPDDEEFDSYLPFGRGAFFTYVENLCEYLAGTPTEEEITEFLSTMPMLNTTIVLNQWDQCLWSQPFQAIPSGNE